MMFGISHFMNKSSNSTSNEVEVAFERWLSTQNKAYSSPAEKNFRKGVFAANFQKVEESNKVYTYTLALNMFADLTEDEFVAKYTGLRHSGNTERNEEYLPEVNQQQSVDWRTKGAVNPVKDQGQCGSCWAFSATSSFESAWFISHNTLNNLAEQQLVDCASVTGNHGCNGGWMDYAFKYIQMVGGQMLTRDYPYTARDQTCKFVKSKAVAQLTGWTDVPQNNCAQLTSSITKQPVSVAIAANAIMMYSGGIFDNPNCGTGLNHGVTAVGYGTDSGKNYWIVRNSWSSSWGEQGYIRMSRDVQTSTGICGICMASSYPKSA
jgi:C1A family cysteine protease